MKNNCKLHSNSALQMHIEGFLPKLAMHIQKKNGQKWHIGRNVA